MKTSLKKLALAVSIASMPMVATAASDITTTTGGGSIAANAALDFRIVIPKFVFLRVGTGTLLADNATVDLVDFDVPALNIGDSTPVAATGGAVSAQVLSNNGNVALVATTLGQLSNGAGDSISFTSITASTSNADLAHPTFVDGAASAAVVVPATAKIVNETANWTFSYANAAVVPAGTYGGVNVNNGRVTYTATAP